METSGEFVEDGTSILFPLEGFDGPPACIKTISSGNKKEGIIYSLIVENNEIPESLE